MSQTQTNALAPHIERARKILQHEQRTQYQDKAILGGGLETFVARWVDETRPLLQNTSLDPAILLRLGTRLEGYRQLTPDQRASRLRLVLADLNELNGAQAATTPPQSATPVVRQEKQTATPPQNANPTQVAPTPRQQKQAMASSSVPATRHAPAPPAKEPDVPQVKRPVEPPPPPPQNTIRLEAGMSQGHTSLTLLSADVSAVPGVGPTTLKHLHHLGIRTVRDLLFYFPREHRDYSKITPIVDVPFNEVSTTMGLIWEVTVKRTRGNQSRTIATISDDSGKLYATWFNQPYLQKQLERAQGCYIVITGKKQRFGNKVEFNVQSHELPEQNDLLNTGRLVPTYALTAGLSAKVLRRFTKWVVDRYAQMVPDHLPASIRDMAQLIALPEAVAKIHYPDNEEERLRAYRRLAFDELFMIQLGMQERRERWQFEAPQGNALTIYPDKIFIDLPGDEDQEISLSSNAISSIGIGSTLWSVTATDAPLEATLPFRYTDAQRRVISEIFVDMAKSKPMCRLLQGDVGAGKTAVAAAGLFMAVLNGSQGAIMAPTELLAEQHARSISKMLEPFGIRTVLLTGSQRASERARGRAMLESGEAAVAIGTHALIQDDVKFYKLGLVIVDEQHRFGVEQRDALRKKGYHPHMLVMTATPIPRTLSLTLYGDLDVSVIDQLPPGRQKIITRWRTGARRAESYDTIRQQVEEGRQAFIICPLIEESESLQVKAATTEYERLQREVFPTLRLGLLHGAMKPAEKDLIMHRFRDHELDILVATSVIEVGIDVPNATVMVIEDADRFGLSQLHQFRGRVGRGKHQSYCYVLSEDAGAQSQERLGVFEEIDDGFRLAEEDLRLRGPGDFIGVRQSGMPEMRIADLSDTRMIELTRKIASNVWAGDPYLRKPEHTALRERMHLFWQDFMAH